MVLQETGSRFCRKLLWFYIKRLAVPTGNYLCGFLIEKLIAVGFYRKRPTVPSLSIQQLLLTTPALLCSHPPGNQINRHKKKKKNLPLFHTSLGSRLVILKWHWSFAFSSSGATCAPCETHVCKPLEASRSAFGCAKLPYSKQNAARQKPPLVAEMGSPYVLVG